MVLDGFHCAYSQNSRSTWPRPKAICDIKCGLSGTARGERDCRPLRMHLYASLTMQPYRRQRLQKHRSGNQHAVAKGRGKAQQQPVKPAPIAILCGEYAMLGHKYLATMPREALRQWCNHGQRPHCGEQRIGAALAQGSGRARRGNERARGMARSTTEKLARASSSNSPRACISTNSTSCPARANSWAKTMLIRSTRLRVRSGRRMEIITVTLPRRE